MKKVSIIKKHKSFLNIFWKLSVLGLIVFFIVSQLSDHKWDDFSMAIIDPFTLSVVLILMAVNWGLEAKKWQVLVGDLTFLESMKSVLIGLLLRQFVSAFGDLSGRLSSGGADKKNQIGSFLVNSLCQTIITILFGLIGLLSIIQNQQLLMEHSQANLIAISAVFLVGITSIIIWNRRFLSKFIHKWFKTLKELTFGLILKILTLSFLRYSVFVIQFFLVFRMMGIDLSTWMVFSGIAFVFLAKSIIPTLNLFGDIGIREFSALLYFGRLGVEPTLIISATLLLWTINIFIPAISAVIFVPKLKLVRN